MQVSASPNPSGDGRRVTLTYSRELDDPSGKLAVLVHSGQLAHLLRQLGRYDEQTFASERELREVLSCLRTVLEVLEPRRVALLAAGRDQFELPWRDMALDAGVPAATAVRWVAEYRGSTPMDNDD